MSGYPSQRVHLGEILRLRKEVVHPFNKPTGRSTFVGLEHLESGTGRRVGELTVDLATLTGRKPKFCRDDIVYGYLRPYLNKVWVAEFDGICSVDQYVYAVDTSRVIPGFVAWFMRSPAYLSQASVKAGPGQLPRIRTDEVADVVIELPPIRVQEEVVRAIEQQLTTVQKARAAADAQREAASRLALVRLQALFETSEARTWPKTELASVATLLPSKSVSNSGDVEVPVVTTACLTEYGFDFEGVKIRRMHAADIAEATISRGEILIARSNTPDLVGRVAMFPGSDGPLVATDLTIRVWPSARLRATFAAASISRTCTRLVTGVCAQVGQAGR